MNALQAIKVLGPIDAKSVQRDPLLRWLVALPVLIALATRWLLPSVVARLEELLQLDLMLYYPALAGCTLLLTTPAMAGMVIGFLLLDQRDDRTLIALQVTPLPLAAYLVYRLATPTLVSVLLSVVVFPIAGLTDVGLASLLVASLAAALLAPLYALGLASIAANKVQGFALIKASGILLAVPVVAYFLRSGWQLAFGIVPTYWPAKLYWVLQAGERTAWIYLLAGGAYQLLLLALLGRRFNTVMYRG